MVGSAHAPCSTTAGNFGPPIVIGGPLVRNSSLANLHRHPELAEGSRSLNHSKHNKLLARSSYSTGLAQNFLAVWEHSAMARHHPTGLSRVIELQSSDSASR